jgi:uncharacterized membrane protein (DUF373 family)
VLHRAIRVAIKMLAVLMAIARKVIILDLEHISAEYVFAIGAVTLALGITYWLVSIKASAGSHQHHAPILPSDP